MDPSFQTGLEVVLGGLGALLFISVLSMIVNSYKAESQKRAITSVAVFNGLILEIGLSPLGTVSNELVRISSVLTVEFSSLIQSLLVVGTILEILYGIGKMWEGSGGFGILAFIIAFIGGAMLPYQGTAVVGMLLIFFALPLVELTPANQWQTRRF